MAACMVWSACCSVMALIVSSHNTPQSSHSITTWRRDSATSKLVTSHLNESAESNVMSRGGVSFNGANDYKSAKRGTARTNRVTVAHSNQLSSNFRRKSKTANNMQDGLNRLKLRDITTEDGLLRRLTRQSGNDSRRSVGGVWSRDEASKTLDLLESSLKSAIEGCSSSRSPVSSLDYQLPAAVLDRFTVEVASGLHAANLLSLIQHPTVEVDRNGEHS